MKKTFLSVFLCLLITGFAFAQEKNSLVFDKPYSRCENKWVSLPKNKDNNEYSFGFVYIDRQGGFTLNVGGHFIIEANGRYTVTPLDKETNMIYRLSGDERLLAVIPEEKVKEMKLPLVPDWLHVYTEGENEPAALFRRGFIFNDVGASDLALTPLLTLYKTEPHYKGLEFELAFAYNALAKFTDAVTILNGAISHNPNEYMFYRELGYSYTQLKKTDEAEATYTKGIAMSADKAQQAEMAFNMAGAYYRLKNKAKFNQWKKVYDTYAGTNNFMDTNIQKMDEELKKI